MFGGSEKDATTKLIEAAHAYDKEKFHEKMTVTYIPASTPVWEALQDKTASQANSIVKGINCFLNTCIEFK